MSTKGKEHIESTIPLVSTRIPSAAWNNVLGQMRGWMEITKYRLALLTGHAVQTSQITRYESGAQCPSIDRYVTMIEALGGVVIVRRGTHEFHLTNTEQK